MMAAIAVLCGIACFFGGWLSRPNDNVGWRYPVGFFGLAFAILGVTILSIVMGASQ